MPVYILPRHHGKLLESKLLVVFQPVYFQRIYNNNGDKTIPDQSDRQYREFKEGTDYFVLLSLRLRKNVINFIFFFSEIYIKKKDCTVPYRTVL